MRQSEDECDLIRVDQVAQIHPSSHERESTHVDIHLGGFNVVT